jgi:hypothetical protein
MHSYHPAQVSPTRRALRQKQEQPQTQTQPLDVSSFDLLEVFNKISLNVFHHPRAAGSTLFPSWPRGQNRTCFYRRANTRLAFRLTFVSVFRSARRLP